MRLITFIRCLICLPLVLLATGCVTPQSYDYTAFRKSRPRSILVLPPVNNTPEVSATNSVFSQLSYPLAESGYYVFPVALVDETFRQNGLSNPAEIHAVDRQKLRDIFGADAALYVTIARYGASYRVFSSSVLVTVQGRLLDLKTGTELWAGSATASDDQGNNSGGGLAGLLIAAAVKQIVNNLMDSSYAVAGRASQQLLYAGRANGLLYGPRKPVVDQPK